MASKKEIILAFDAYGTLLSTESIAKQVQDLLGSRETAEAVAKEWRTQQLEYTWRLNSMNQYIPFSEVTRRALSHALKAAPVGSDFELSQKMEDELMHAYDSLSTFPDVSPGLKVVASHARISAVVFSNGTNAMVSTSVHESEDLKPHAGLFKDIICVDDMPAAKRKFKPAPEVYRWLGERVGKGEEELGDVWLVSGNPFDVVGAMACGMRACWVDRAGKGWVDGLGDAKPTAVVKGLDGIVEAVEGVVKGSA